jgi:hypothetical protein
MRQERESVGARDRVPTRSPCEQAEEHLHIGIPCPLTRRHPRTVLKGKPHFELFRNGEVRVLWIRWVDTHRLTKCTAQSHPANRGCQPTG